MRNKYWSKDEEKFLLDNWGVISIKLIAKRLNRSKVAVEIKASKLKLSKKAYWQDGEFITFYQLCTSLGIEQSYSYYKYKLERTDFPFECKKFKQGGIKNVLAVSIDKFWPWIENNQTKIDFKNFEKYSLGPEPDWVDKKRKRDVKRSINISTEEWSSAEEEKLIFLVNQHKYGYSYIAKDLGRTIGAVIRRLIDLNIKARPIRESPHAGKWTDEQFEDLKKLIIEREDYYVMENVIGKSSKAIRGAVYRLYGSENLDIAYKNLMEQEKDVSA